MEHRIKVKTREELSLVGKLLDVFEKNYKILGPEALEINLKQYGDAQKPNYELSIVPAKGYEISQVCQENTIESRGNKLVVSTPDRIVLQIDKHRFSVDYKPGK